MWTPATKSKKKKNPHNEQSGKMTVNVKDPQHGYISTPTWMQFFGKIIIQTRSSAICWKYYLRRICALATYYVLFNRTMETVQERAWNRHQSVLKGSRRESPKRSTSRHWSLTRGFRSWLGLFYFTKSKNSQVCSGGAFGGKDIEPWQLTLNENLSNP